jgi:hypothetical protein
LSHLQRLAANLRMPKRPRRNPGTKSQAAGYIPGPGVALDSHGNLYGITLGNLQHNSTLFELTPPATSGAAWSETTLYTFTGTADGAGPNGVLLVRGNAIIGTTIVGGSSQYGTVYELTH